MDSGRRIEYPSVLRSWVVGVVEVEVGWGRYHWVVVVVMGWG